MQIFYMKKSSLKVLLVILAIVVLAVICYALFMPDHEPTLAEPIYQGDDSEKKVALAINVDWGEDIIHGMLAILEEKEAKATFFVTGRFAEKYPDTVRLISEKGQEIENHGYAHPHPDELSKEENSADILKAEEILEKLKGSEMKFFAPPYGEHGESVLQAAEENGYRVIMWTLDTIDWRDNDPAVLIERASGEKAVNGAIILMHPKSYTLEALPEIIDNLRSKGYTLVSMVEMLP